MRKSVAAVVLALLVAACSQSEGGEGGQQVAAGLPPLSSAWFGTSFDPGTLSVIGKATSVKAGTPIVVVGHLLSAHDVAGIKVRVSAAGNVEGEVPAVGPNEAATSDVLAADLSSLNLGPGTHVVAFVTSTSTIVASATLVVTG